MKLREFMNQLQDAVGRNPDILNLDVVVITGVGSNEITWVPEKLRTEDARTLVIEAK